MVGQENTFNSSDLIQYVESLIKETRQLESNLDKSNYGWLRARHLRDDAIEDLDVFKPMIQKMSPESCTSVAVKLDLLTEDVTSTDVILTTFKNLLDEEDSMIIMAGSIKRGKKRVRRNRVRPVLTPPGREPVVSFILEAEY